MAKPKVFLSSTCYDLDRVRQELDAFLVDRGFEVLNSQSLSFGVKPGVHSHSACLAEVDRADYVILLIGGRRGGTFIGSTNSITNEEYNRAEKLGIPRIVCADRKVFEYRESFRKNPSGDHKHIVDDIRIFTFLDYVNSGHSDNWIHGFDSIEDIRNILTTQFAHYLCLFSEQLRKPQRTESTLPAIVAFPDNLSGVAGAASNQDEATALREGLKGLHNVLTQIITDDSNSGAKLEKLKQLWVLALHGELVDGERLIVSMDTFKQYAWSYQRATRVNRQFESYGVRCFVDDDPTDPKIRMSFVGAGPDAPIAWALQVYVNKLVAKYGDSDSIEVFRRADMRVFS